MNDYKQMVKAYEKAGGENIFSQKDVAHVVLERDKVLASNLVDGLKVDIKKKEKGKVAFKIVVKAGYQILKPVHMCFGVLPQEGVQLIDMEIEVEKDATVSIIADCVFPNAVKVQHIMDARIFLAQGASYQYQENHYHGETAGVEVRAKALLDLAEDSYLKTIFSLLKGRVGIIDFDYEASLAANAKMEMLARVSARGDDKIKIREAGFLKGKGAKGILDTKIALKDEAEAEILNELIASGPKARGHVDCTEIINDKAKAKAIPIVEVRHPQAKVTHEAAIGSVDNTQLQTLMARGLKEKEATELIIQGLLNG